MSFRVIAFCSSSSQRFCSLKSSLSLFLASSSAKASSSLRYSTTYTKGGSIISAYPEEATVLMRASSEDNFYKAGWWNGIDDPDGGLKGQVVAIDYQSGGLDMTVFCTSITNKAHQTDDYRLATNAIYSKLLGADFTVSDAGQDEPVPEPVPEPSSPRTGDDMNVVAWIAAAVLSMGMAAVFTTRKKAR